MVKIKEEKKPDSGTGSTDIAFLLIIFFMVSITTVINTGIGMQMKKPKPQTQLNEALQSEVIALELPTEGGYKLNNIEVNNLEALKPLLKDKISAIAEPKTSVLVADRRLYSELLALLDMSSDLGLNAFSIRSNSGFGWGLKVKSLLTQAEEKENEGASS